MGKPVAGDVVVLPFPQTNDQPGKRRPALVVAGLPGDDLVLCQITSQARPDALSIPLTNADLDRGQLAVDSFVRAGRLFTIQYSVILYTAAHAKQAKLDEVRAAIRRLFS
jgi:mRNA interferase MazF